MLFIVFVFEKILKEDQHLEGRLSRVIIELQKLVLSRMRMGEDVIGLNEIICQLRLDIGWG